MTAYVVESLASPSVGVVGPRALALRPVGTFRLYVATEARAREVASAAPGRTYRAVSVAELPVAARENLERSARETS